jgi:hypothetical protein
MSLLFTISLDAVLVVVAPFLGYRLLRLLGAPKETEIFPGMNIRVQRSSRPE